MAVSTAREAVMSKTLAEMTIEVVENNKRLGWYDKPVTFEEAMCMLHSEVSEALEAWRKWGTEDRTKIRFTCDDPQCGDSTWDHECDPPPSKPEGVGSEFADIFIRLLDDCQLFGLADPDKRVAEHKGRFGVSTSFVANLNTLHTLIVRACMAWESNDWDFEDSDRGGWTWKNGFTDIFIFLRQLCDEYGIDLDAEYERKIAYNRTRAYRHGGKAI
jgi:hypothetical protein